jgi:hypothetical protein
MIFTDYITHLRISFIKLAFHIDNIISGVPKNVFSEVLLLFIQDRAFFQIDMRDYLH